MKKTLANLGGGYNLHKLGKLEKHQSRVGKDSRINCLLDQEGEFHRVISE